MVIRWSFFPRRAYAGYHCVEQFVCNWEASVKCHIAQAHALSKKLIYSDRAVNNSSSFSHLLSWIIATLRYENIFRICLLRFSRKRWTCHLNLQCNTSVHRNQDRLLAFMQKQQEAREATFRKIAIQPLQILQIRKSSNFKGTGLLNAGCFTHCSMSSSRTQEQNVLIWTSLFYTSSNFSPLRRLMHDNFFCFWSD